MDCVSRSGRLERRHIYISDGLRVRPLAEWERGGMKNGIYFTANAAVEEGPTLRERHV